ncbi:MAG: FHA domain-containing protein [Nostoc sp.]|uniref:FHA domain-containing protein n=1 Tax=unclassified Nostoc TaxID=2593658 RepID=UPI00261F49EF|nr:FHA domain-containing protein [Nostoc sp. S13]
MAPLTQAAKRLILRPKLQILLAVAIYITHFAKVTDSNGTYINGAKLQPQVFSPLQTGDRVSLGQGHKITFMFRVQQHSASATKNPTPNFAPTEITAPTIAKEEEDQVILASKLISLGLILAGLHF